MEKIQVVAVIIEKNGKYLLGKRSPLKKSAPHYWCPVTGRVEKDETQAQAVVREAMEEVGLVVQPLERIHSYISDDKSAQIHWWKVKIISGEASLQNDEHTELRWVSLEEMKGLHPIFEDDLARFRTPNTDLLKLTRDLHTV